MSETAVEPESEHEPVAGALTFPDPETETETATEDQAVADAALAAPRAKVSAADVPADPELLRRNLELTARAKRGDTFQIVGRVLTIAGGVGVVIGLGVLVNASFDPDGHGWTAGQVTTWSGLTTAAAGGGLWIYGATEVRKARRGEVRMSLAPGGLRVRF